MINYHNFLQDGLIYILPKFKFISVVVASGKHKYAHLALSEEETKVANKETRL